MQAGVLDNLDDLVSAADAADACGVSVKTVYSWNDRGYLMPSGLDERGRKLYRLIDVLRTARDTRQKAIGTRRIA